MRKENNEIHDKLMKGKSNEEQEKLFERIISLEKPRNGPKADVIDRWKAKVHRCSEEDFKANPGSASGRGDPTKGLNLDFALPKGCARPDGPNPEPECKNPVL